MSFRRFYSRDKRVDYKNFGTKNPPITDILLFIWLQINNEKHQKDRRAVRRQYLEYIALV